MNSYIFPQIPVGTVGIHQVFRIITPGKLSSSQLVKQIVIYKISSLQDFVLRIIII